jgi:hypothetical protein
MPPPLVAAALLRRAAPRAAPRARTIAAAAAAAAARQQHSAAIDDSGSDDDARPRVVVLGTGWGAFAFMRALDHARFDVHVVSPRNHMLFTPLLASTAVGASFRCGFSTF